MEFVILLIIVILLIYVNQDKYNRNNNAHPPVRCDEYIPIYNEMYYQIPKLKTIDESKEPYQKAENMNDLTTSYHQMKQIKNSDDIMNAKWSSFGDISNKSNSGSAEYDNMDVTINPKQLQKHLNISNPEYTSYSKYHSKNEQFADDGYYNPNFSYNEKYQYDADGDNLNLLLDATFNNPDDSNDIISSNANINNETNVSDSLNIVSPAIKKSNLQTPKPTIPTVSIPNATPAISVSELITQSIEPKSLKKSDNSIKNNTSSGDLNNDTPIKQDPKKEKKVNIILVKPKSKFNPKALKELCKMRKARKRRWF